MFIVNVEGAIHYEGKWLVILRSSKEEHAGGTLSLVGGKVDQEGFSSDILERTVKREIFEEVGVEVEDTVEYVSSTSFVTEEGTHVINTIFLCHYQQGDAHPKSPDEVDEVFWMTRNEIIQHHLTPPWLKDSILRAEKKLFAKKLSL